MKTLLTGLCLLLLSAYSSQAQTTLTASERKEAQLYFQAGADSLHNSIAGLSEAQLNWKPQDTVWSIAQCVAHIALSENEIFEWAQQTIQSAPQTDTSGRPTDAQVKAMVESRSHKVKTHASLEPKHQFSNAAAALAAFDTSRASHIRYIADTEEDLRHHISESPLGRLDAYQVLLLVNGHTLRHVAQIESVKAMEGFPAN
ncbi:hypothetical protein GCM10027051_32180 [Niabella terrae]